MELDGSRRGYRGPARHLGRSGGPGAGGRLLLLLDLSAVLHVLRPVVLLTGLVAVVGIPTAVVLSLVQTVATLWVREKEGGVERERGKEWEEGG